MTVTAMGRYKVLVRGDNFLLSLDGEHAKFGFYATRIVKSETAEDAERIAIIRIHQELNQSDHIIKNTADVPSVKVEKTVKMGSFQFIRKQRVRGFSFHPEEEAAPDQKAQC